MNGMTVQFYEPPFRTVANLLVPCLATPPSVARHPRFAAAFASTTYENGRQQSAPALTMSLQLLDWPGQLLEKIGVWRTGGKLCGVMSARWSGEQEQRGSGCFEHLRINGSPGLLSLPKELEGF